MTLPELGGPVVVLVLDEFPAATIMRPDGTINNDRFPGFAELASVSTWFRNASSQHNLTHRARAIDPRRAPRPRGHAADLHRSSTQPVHAVRWRRPGAQLRVGDSLCPPDLCAETAPLPLTQRSRTPRSCTGIVLPGALRDGLPPIDNSWGAYGAQEERRPAVTTSATPTRAGSGSAPTSAARSVRRQSSASARRRSPRSRLHFVHVAVPHRPWVLSPSGNVAPFAPELIRDPDQPRLRVENRMEFQLHSLQVGAADTLIAELLDQVRGPPNWEQTMLVVTSDHGSNLTPPDLGRMRITEANREEAFRVPLFVKAPGQTTGDIGDASAQVIDVLPSIVDLVDAEVDWDFDGHSLFDGSSPTIEPRVSTDVGRRDRHRQAAGRGLPPRRRLDRPRAVGEFGDLVGADGRNARGRHGSGTSRHRPGG